MLRLEIHGWTKERHIFNRHYEPPEGYTVEKQDEFAKSCLSEYYENAKKHGQYPRSRRYAWSSTSGPKGITRAGPTMRRAPRQ